MEKVALIGSQLIAISHPFQRSLSGIPTIEKVAEVLSRFLKVFRFQHIINGQFAHHPSPLSIGERDGVRGRCNTLYPNFLKRKKRALENYLTLS
jgi:hypothetical protein